MKYFIILLLMLLMTSACSRDIHIRLGDSMNVVNNQQTLIISLNSLSVFQSGNKTAIVIESDGLVQKLVEFSMDRKCCAVYGLTLIKNGDFGCYMGGNINELKEKLGEAHADIGSGFYIPAYITEDGYLICFELEDNVVCEVMKRDLLTNEIVERLSQ